MDSTNGDSLWMVVLLLLVAVAAPTMCVLWFMNEAMSNERLVTRQKLTSVYQSQLLAVEQRLHRYWEEKQIALASMAAETPAPEVFASLIETGLADSVIVYDTAGRVMYPASAKVKSAVEFVESRAWSQARRLEFERHDNLSAASAYMRIASETLDSNQAVRALQARARCLAKAGLIDDAIEVLTEDLGKERYRQCVDSQGRLTALNAELLALQLMKDEADTDLHRIAGSLRLRLSNYNDADIPAGQRLFLMSQLEILLPGDLKFPTLAAEELAARYVESDRQLLERSTLHRSGLPNVWQMQPLNSRVRALFHEQSIVENVQSLIADQSLPADVTVMVYPPGAEPEPSTAFVSLTLDKYMNGWRLALNIDDQSLFDAAANKRILSYLWTGVLVIAVLVIAAVLGGGAVRRQLRLAGLKNDLVASVSHELKTPLSSMRLLVDTLLNANRLDEHKVREYLHLIAKENTRLSRLIDNFLTFSRMQRSKPIFKKTETEAAKIAYTAVEAIGEKFDRERCRLEMQVASDLPNIMADLDALVTVVLNLLDNAYKYSEGDKHIVLRAYADKSYVYFEVQDKGVGLSRRAAKKVFKRFYQVDQRLSRAGGGCGLGLNIVQSIVTAHDGTISVDSEPGKGSTFTVRIPVAGSKSPRGIGGSG